MRVCLGGTFHPFHAGHRALLAAAAEDAGLVAVGVTTGALAVRPDRDVPGWRVRAARVRDELARLGYPGNVETFPLEDPMGPAADGDFDRIVVSSETASGADRINETRMTAGLRPLEVRVVSRVLAEDLLPLSGTRVQGGDVDEEGRRLTDVRVAVGSANPVKLAAVESEVARILSLPIEVRGHGVPSGVAEQPKGSATMGGARGRAAAALEAWPEADYAVGVEAGLLEEPGGGSWFDVQACAVRDRSGHETRGFGPGFQYPGWVTARALAGEMVSDILGPVAGDLRIGGTTGAVGYLTDGLLDRTGLTRQAVLMAFVPRIRHGLYTALP